MQGFRVKFLNTLLSSDGHQFKCLQRMIPIRRAKSLERAIRAAQRRFEKAEHIRDWRLHAHSVEIESEDNGPNTSKNVN
jgi:hypothetical protein